MFQPVELTPVNLHNDQSYSHAQGQTVWTLSGVRLTGLPKIGHFLQT